MPVIRTLAQLAQFRETVRALPIGTKVKAGAVLLAQLAKSKAGRLRNPDIIGIVEEYDDLQLRVLVRWAHPDFKDDPVDHPGNLEPLAPFYLDLVEEA